MTDAVYRKKVRARTDVGTVRSGIEVLVEMEPLEKVLLVDHDVASLASMGAVLSKHFQIRVCTSTRVALHHVAREPFHVVCSVSNLPEMSGLELCRAIRMRQPE